MTTTRPRSASALGARPAGTWGGPLVAVTGVAAISLVAPHGIGAPAVLSAWWTVWVAICIQALPFLVLGVVLSGGITAFVPRDVIRRVVPRQPVRAVAAAGLSGVVLPGCECSSVPVASSLIRTGVPPAGALTFLLAAPAVNPVVLVSTAVAFAGQPTMVVARFVAGLLSACTVGWLWIRFGRPSWIRGSAVAPRAREPARSLFCRTAVHDLLHAGGFLVAGAGIASAVHVLLPPQHLAGLAAPAVRAVLVMGLLAVLVSLCSEADAFVAASLTAFSPTAQLVFMTVGPMVDLKLVAMQAGTFGPGFAVRFAPVTFAVAVGAAAAVGAVVL